MNRAIMIDSQIADIISGTFIVAYAPPYRSDFGSLPEELQHKYLEKFKNPELFIRKDGVLKIISLKD